MPQINSIAEFNEEAIIQLFNELWVMKVTIMLQHRRCQFLLQAMHAPQLDECKGPFARSSWGSEKVLCMVKAQACGATQVRRKSIEGTMCIRVLFWHWEPARKIGTSDSRAWQQHLGS